MNLPIEGMMLFNPNQYKDGRGFFAEIFRNIWLKDENLEDLQLNHSNSAQGVLRGLHYHKNQFDYWYFVNGAAQVAFVDLRPESPTYKMVDNFVATNKMGIYIPPMVAHGFLALTPVDLIYVVNQYYDANDDNGLLFDDIELNIPWKYQKGMIMSDRDRESKTLSEVEKTL